ncbi:Uncharacterized protein ChrSV_2584 [Chromobacterium vaccinii]|uniref:hypothetical protein n=1 Tax=Chromobacterium vaccinii TaxID=1108595 RepID=UPI001E2CA6F2|nr:hypothetical protein [Chromobacterium vaccinii]MCD4500961.1 hypothetical protein [Chromobacterium vaccinii]QND84810.1 Uncharacterized protein ChrSW_2584 [Chromobacterium vaccinii]QND90041.1 Uncharacterized protein ChrSV_2584 [Chromobacterium vaccinii]
MIYTKRIFGQELEAFLSGEVLDHAKISTWAYATKLNNVRNIDPDVDRWLEELGAMDMGEEFELSLEELMNLVVSAKS